MLIAFISFSSYCEELTMGNRIKKLKELYNKIYSNELILTGEQKKQLSYIESIIKHPLTDEVKKILIYYGDSKNTDVLFADPINLSELAKMYSNMDYKDEKVGDYTYRWKGNMSDNFTINKVSEDDDQYFEVEIVEKTYKKWLYNQELKGGDYERFYDLSVYIPIANIDASYDLLDISERYYGRIIGVDEDSVDYFLPSFRLHLEDLIQGLESGKYQLDEYGDIELPEWYERFSLKQVK